LGFIKRTYDWVLSFAKKPYAVWMLFFFSFVESSFFPIPPDVLLIPLVIANPKKTFKYVSVCTIGSVLGGIFGYLIGAFFMDTIGIKIISFYNAEEYFKYVSYLFNKYGVWAVGVAGLTPIPYKIFTIASGAFNFNLFSFTLTSFIARGLRFAIEGLLLYVYGEKIRIFIEKYFNFLTIVFVLLLVLGYVIITFIV
jgi:membrane protein YqaA with SNARE-associated domain